MTVSTRAKIKKANRRAKPTRSNGRTGRKLAVAQQTPSGIRARATTHKWVYMFREGNKDMRDLLGGKGAGLAEMTRAGLPVPPGFIITTEACNTYVANGKKFPEGMWEQTLAALKKVERAKRSAPTK